MKLLNLNERIALDRSLVDWRRKLCRRYRVQLLKRPAEFQRLVRLHDTYLTPTMESNR